MTERRRGRPAGDRQHGLNLRIPPEVHEALRRAAAAEDRTQTAILERALRRYLRAYLEEEGR